MSATPGQMTAAVLLPPFGVYLKRGGGPEFWTAAGLTLLAFVPGVAFALWSVLRGENPPQHGKADHARHGGVGGPQSAS